MRKITTKAKQKSKDRFNQIIVGLVFATACQSQKSSVKEVPDLSTLHIRYEPIAGLGPEEGVIRRDPSDIIRVDGVYYLWYTKVLQGAYLYPEGFQGTLWYATSNDGVNWQEQGEALEVGEKGSFDDFGVSLTFLTGLGTAFFTKLLIIMPHNNKVST